MTSRGQAAGRGAGHLSRDLLRFGVVGAGTTVLHLGLFALLTPLVPAQGANLLALVAATVVNTSLNRVWTFGARPGTRNVAREQAQGLLVFLLTWAGTGGGLALLGHVWPDASTTAQVLALAVGTAVSTAARFLAMRYWIFGAERTR